MKKRVIMAILMLTMCFEAYSQVILHFIPELHGRNIDGLFGCKIVNTSAPAAVYLTIEVAGIKGNKLFEVTTRDFRLLQGSSKIPAAVINKTDIRFANTKEATFIRQNGYFPQGEYEYTFSVYAAQNDNLLLQQTFDYFLEPLTELILTEPYNNDELCNNRPLLSWQPSLPSVPGSLYRLILAEIKNNQTAVEALNYNYPVINQAGINSPVLAYPSIAKSLEQGKRYAWQVTAYKDQTILNRSDIWQFTVNCEDALDEIIKDDGYRDIEDLLKGNFYLAAGSLRFSLINSYSAQSLTYSIESVNAPGKKIKHLRKITLSRGKNKITLNLSDNHKFKSGDYYLLKITLPNGYEKTLRFLYK